MSYFDYGVLSLSLKNQLINMDHGSHHGEIGPLYWIVWVIGVVTMEATGFVKAVSDTIPTIPHHGVTFIESYEKLIPMLITAGICAVFSFLVQRLCWFCWDRLLIQWNKWFPKK